MSKAQGRPLIFFIGGVRSGKSALAQRWAEALGEHRLYLASCSASSLKDDAEMAARVQAHKKARRQGWQTLEEPLRLDLALNEVAESRDPPNVILLDCLSLWLTNLLLAELAPKAIQERVARLCSALSARKTAIAVVSQETGLGLLPQNRLARQFCDLLGFANQAVANVSDKVVFVAAGLPLALKGDLPNELL